MANNRLILQILVDFVSKVPIFKLFLEGVILSPNVPKFKKVPSRVGGGRVIATWELFPSFGAF